MLSESPAFEETENLQILPLHKHTQDDSNEMFAFPYILRKCVNVMVVEK